MTGCSLQRRLGDTLSHLRATGAPPAGSSTQMSPLRAAHVRAQNPDSLAHTTAYLIAAVILYIPANLLPIMHTATLVGWRGRHHSQRGHRIVEDGFLAGWRSSFSSPASWSRCLSSLR